MALANVHARVERVNARFWAQAQLEYRQARLPPGKVVACTSGQFTLNRNSIAINE